MLELVSLLNIFLYNSGERFALSRTKLATDFCKIYQFFKWIGHFHVETSAYFDAVLTSSDTNSTELFSNDHQGIINSLIFLASSGRN